MKKQNPSHVPQKDPSPFNVMPPLFLALSIVLAVGMWLTSLILYPTLPDAVPAHFGFDGQPDQYAQRSLFPVLLLPIIQTLLTVLLILVYRKPQYMQIPASVLLTTLPEPFRSKLFAVYRETIASLSALLNVLFTYLTLVILRSGTTPPELNPWIFWGIIAVIIILAVTTTHAAWDIVRKAVAHKHLVADTASARPQRKTTARRRRARKKPVAEL